MAEPVEAAVDFRAMVGAAGAITLAFYRPATDDHGDPQDTTGTRDPKAGSYQSTGDGEVRVTRTTWFVDCSGLSGRPPMKSLIADGADTWVIDDVGPDAADAVYSFRCTLKG